MTKEVAAKEPNEAALIEAAKKYGAIGANEALDQSDIELKRLKLSQGTSDVVTDGKMMSGRYYNAQDGTELGSNESPAEFIICSLDKVWMEFDLVWNEDKKRDERVFKQIVPVTPETSSLPYLEEANKIARDFNYNFYMLSAEELKSGACIPYVFSMSRTQTKPAKTLNSKILEIAANGLPSFAYVFNFTSESKQKGEGEDIKKWQQVVVKMGRITTPKEMEEADKWRKMINDNQSNVTVPQDVAESKPAASSAVSEDDLPF